MENRNLEKAMEIFSLLVKGENIGSKYKDTSSLYDEYVNNSEVYDMVMQICKKMNLSLYEYRDELFVSPGDNNRVFGFTNDELKREIGIRLNRELYLCFFIMYAIILRFYSDTSNSTFTEYIKVEDMLNAVDSMLAETLRQINIISLDDIEENSFKSISAAWEDLPLLASEDTTFRAARGSKTGFVKLVFNFMERQELIVENDQRFYPTNRLRALVENYFEEYKGRLYEIMKGATEDASYQQD